MKVSTITLVFGMLFMFGGAHHVSAHTPVMVTQKNVDAVTVISDPTLSQAFYGSLSNFPHTFEFVTKEPMVLYTEILVPDIDNQPNTPSGIIIKIPESGGRVEEITRLSARDASWDAQYEFFGGDTYRHGPTFEKEIAPGRYRIEVHTPDNQEKYVLVVGKREDMVLGYIELIRRIAQVKEFFGKTTIALVQSPFVYVPLLTLVCAGVWYRRRQMSK